MLSRNVVWIIVAVALVFLFLNLPSWLSHACRTGIMGAFSPLIKLERIALDTASVFKQARFSSRRLKRENITLQKRVQELSREVMMLRYLRSENDRLNRLLSFKTSSPQQLLPARVVGRDASQWYSGILIDKGRGEGVMPDMAVICEGGLVGKVIESGPGMSKVLLIVDKRSRVGGIVERSRETGIIEGTSFNTCRLNYLPRQPDAHAGDRVDSSGLGGVYPKGLYIGMVKGVYEGEYGLYAYADISPGVDFSRLEEVFVIIRGKENEGDFLK